MVLRPPQSSRGENDGQAECKSDFSPDSPNGPAHRVCLYRRCRIRFEPPVCHILLP